MTTQTHEQWFTTLAEEHGIIGAPCPNRTIAENLAIAFSAELCEFEGPVGDTQGAVFWANGPIVDGCWSEGGCISVPVDGPPFKREAPHV